MHFIEGIRQLSARELGLSLAFVDIKSADELETAIKIAGSKRVAAFVAEPVGTVP